MNTVGVLYQCFIYLTLGQHRSKTKYTDNDFKIETNIRMLDRLEELKDVIKVLQTDMTETLRKINTQLGVETTGNNNTANMAPKGYILDMMTRNDK